MSSVTLSVEEIVNLCSVVGICVKKEYSAHGYNPEHLKTKITIIEKDEVFDDFENKIYEGAVATFTECSGDGVSPLAGEFERSYYLIANKPPICEVIDELKLSRLTESCLRAEGIKWVGQLVSWTAKELTSSPNIGLKRLREIEHSLSSKGLSLTKGVIK